MASRYNRQELLSFIGRKGQLKLLRSTTVIVGLGALGTVASELLARAGIGSIKIIDRDVVEPTDLQRQLLYDESDVGKPKALAAAGKLKKINSGIQIIAAAKDIDYKNITAAVGKLDVILDCTDNLETRFMINEYCLKNKLAWVHAAAIKETAQMMVFDFRKKSEKPCFACTFGNSAAEGTCDTVGVLSSATAIIAAMQATEAIKLMIGIAAETRMLRLNVLQNELAKIAVKKNPNCKSCGKDSSHDYLDGKKAKSAVAMCGRGTYQIKGEAVNLPALKLQLQKTGEKVADFGECVSFRNITLFKDGRALVKAGSAGEAKASYARHVGL
ncbi:ThiF family adenylyltransferase [Candidatus Woesearchaeota archaeon]|nr:ThiF family adenylyltransferase [Candidatus Woesearchaeota archaeon]